MRSCCLAYLPSPRSNSRRSITGCRGGDYVPFEGNLPDDTFQMYEERRPRSRHYMRITRSGGTSGRRRILRVIGGNPPYSAGQRQRQTTKQCQCGYPYPRRRRIRIPIAASRSKADAEKNSLYDSYIRRVPEGIPTAIGESNGIQGMSAMQDGSTVMPPSDSSAGCEHALRKSFPILTFFTCAATHALRLRDNAEEKRANVFGASTHEHQFN